MKEYCKKHPKEELVYIHNYEDKLEKICRICEEI